MHSSTRKRQNLCKIPIRTPEGHVIATVIEEGGERVLTRRVGEKHRYRHLDAWPLGAHAVNEACRLHVVRLCYTASDGAYEVNFSDFLARATRFDFPHEVQLVLPRREWTFVPAPTRPTQMNLQLDVTAP